MTRASSEPAIHTRQTRSKRKVRFSEELVADAAPRQRREAAALDDEASASTERAVVEDAAVSGEATQLEEAAMPEDTEEIALPDAVQPEQAAPDESVILEVQPCGDDDNYEPSSTTVVSESFEATTDQVPHGPSAMPPADAPSTPAAVPNDGSLAPSTVNTAEQAAREEEPEGASDGREATIDQVPPGPSATPPAHSPSTPAAIPEEGSPSASTAQTAQKEEPVGGGGPSTDAVDGRGDLRWSLMESKLDRALQALASLAASQNALAGKVGAVDGRLGEISASLGTPARSNAWY